MRTSAESLDGNKVKITVEVEATEMERAETETLRRLALDARVPGFRPGKVPRRLIEARLGPKGIRGEALREALPTYYADAISEESLDVIAAPEIDITAGEEQGPVVFSAIVEVRPEVLVPGYEGIAVTVASPEATQAEIDAQVDRLREQFATLTEVGRAARDGDFVTIDVHGTRDGAPAEGLSADGLVYQLGTGGIVEGADEQLRNAKPGEIFELDADDAPGGPAHLRLLLKQVRERVLPEANDEFASDASEFDTLSELRVDLANRMNAMKRLQATLELRQQVTSALVELVAEDPPKALADVEQGRLAENFLRRLAERRVSLSDYLEAIGQSQEEFLAELETQAVREVKTDLALRAIAKDQAIEVDESDLDEEIVHLASHGTQSPAELRESLERSGRMTELRSEIRKSKALNWLIEHVVVTDAEGNPVDRALLQPEAHDHDDDHEQGTIEAGEASPHSEDD